MQLGLDRRRAGLPDSCRDRKYAWISEGKQRNQGNEDLGKDPRGGKTIKKTNEMMVTRRRVWGDKGEGGCYTRSVSQKNFNIKVKCHCVAISYQ